MFDIGYFYDDEAAFRAAYFSHAYGLTRHPTLPDVSIDDRNHQITIGKRRHMYFMMREDKRWKQQVSGLEFHAVLIDCKNSSDKHWIMSRFRPQ